MKHLLYLLIVTPLIFLSCKKEHSSSSNIPTGKKYKVTFNVSNFKAQLGAFSSTQKVNGLKVNSPDQLNTYFDVLYYMVYDQQYPAPPTIITQDSTMSDMGTIVDSLTPGSYKVIILAGKKGLSFVEPERLTDATYGYGGKWQDVFYYTNNAFSVGSGNNVYEVTLQREVGKLELQLLDAIPANADSLSITINPELTNKILNYGSNDFGSTSKTITFSQKIPAAAKGHTNFIMDRIIGNTYLPFTATIVCKDASNNIIANKVVNDVSCQANYRTILSGNLFGTPPTGNSQSFTAKIDTAWNSTTIQSSF